MSSSKPQAPRVLIIGAGCTGALTAALLRQQWDARCPKDADDLNISVWEWGRGPAGRMSTFWKDIDGERVVADVGAQVVSLRDEALLPSWLKSYLFPAEPTGLGVTTERRTSGWYHFHAKDGLTSLQWASLKEARVDDCRFESRVTEVVQLPGERFPRWRVGFGGAGKSRQPAGFEEFDAVVFTGTATDAIGLEGIKSALSNAQQVLLKSVGYDHRIAVSLLLKPEFSEKLKSLCHGQAELAVESKIGTGPLSLLARQEVKGRSHHNACAVTLHSTPQFAAANLQDAKRAGQHPKERGSLAMHAQLAEMLAISVRALEAAVIDSKVVHWRQCQVTRSRQERSARVKKCMVASTAPSLIIAGDYLVHAEIAGSFEGCLESATEAARAACDVLLGIEPGTSSEFQICRLGEPSGQYPGSPIMRSSEADVRHSGTARAGKSRWGGSAAAGNHTEIEGCGLINQVTLDKSKGEQRGPRRWQRKKPDSEFALDESTLGFVPCYPEETARGS